MTTDIAPEKKNDILFDIYQKELNDFCKHMESDVIHIPKSSRYLLKIITSMQYEILKLKGEI